MAFPRGNRLGHLVAQELEPVGIHASHDEAEALAGLRTDRPDDVLPDRVAQVRYGAAVSRLHPTSPWARIAFHPALVGKPQLHLGIGGQDAPWFQKGLARLWGVLELREAFGLRCVHRRCSCRKNFAETRAFHERLGFETGYWSPGLEEGCAIFGPAQAHQKKQPQVAAASSSLRGAILTRKSHTRLELPTACSRNPAPAGLRLPAGRRPPGANFTT